MTICSILQEEIFLQETFLQEAFLQEQLLHQIAVLKYFLKSNKVNNAAKTLKLSSTQDISSFRAWSGSEFSHKLVDYTLTWVVARRIYIHVNSTLTVLCNTLEISTSIHELLSQLLLLRAKMEWRDFSGMCLSYTNSPLAVREVQG